MILVFRDLANDSFYVKATTIIADVCLMLANMRLDGVNFDLLKQFHFLFIVGQQHKVQCSEDMMKVLVALPDSDTRVSLEGLNGYKNEKCEPKIEDNLAVFELSLINFYDCGIIRVVNKLTVSGGVWLILYSHRTLWLISHRNALFLLFIGQENVLSQDRCGKRKWETNSER